MPLNHYQQEVGPSLADASSGKMPDVALLEGQHLHIIEIITKGYNI